MALALDAYFDESERQDGTEPISIAGYVFKPAGYKSFCRAWKRVLSCGPSPTTHFHMTTLYARTYEYDGWTVEQRAETLRLAVEAVKGHMFCGISVLFSQQEFEALAPPMRRFEYGSIYAAACQMVLNVTGLWMDDHKCYLPIAYAFESGHRFWNEANQILEGTNQFPALKKKLHYRTHFSLDKTESFGLQAADMLAWIFARLNVGAPDNHTMNAFRPHIMSLLVEGQNARYQLFHPKADGLQMFFRQTKEREDDKMLVHFRKDRKPRKLRLR